MNKPAIWLLTLTSCLCSACGSDGPGPAGADIVFTGGRIYTVNEAQPWAEAIELRLQSRNPRRPIPALQIDVVRLQSMTG